jgi:hypothetical protein
MLFIVKSYEVLFLMLSSFLLLEEILDCVSIRLSFSQAEKTSKLEIAMVNTDFLERERLF